MSSRPVDTATSSFTDAWTGVSGCFCCIDPHSIAAYAAARLPKDRTARIVRIYGAPTDNNAKMFKQGQDNILLPLIAAGKIEVVHEDWALDWKPENGKKIMNAALTKAGRAIDRVFMARYRPLPTLSP